MGNLILCRSPKKARSYYSEKLGIHLYSAEELCYYIYNNLMLIDDSFVDERLFNFLENLGYGQLIEKLKKWKDDSTVWELMLVILQDIHYYSTKELDAFKDEAIRISREGYEGVYKEKADYLVGIGRIYDAIRMYDQLLSAKDMDNNAIKADILCSKGKALTRLFAYADALTCYVSAYELTGDTGLLRSIYMLKKIDGSLRIPFELIKTALADEYDALTAKWDEEFESVKAQIAQKAPVVDIAGLMQKDSRKRKEGFLDIISDWKNEYKRNQS